jgi:hypothetical protein
MGLSSTPELKMPHVIGPHLTHFVSWFNFISVEYQINIKSYIFKEQGILSLGLNGLILNTSTENQIDHQSWYENQMTTKNITLKFKLLFELCIFSTFHVWILCKSANSSWIYWSQYWSLYVENVTSWELRGFSVGKFSVGTPPVIKYFVSALQKDRY